MPPIYGGVGGDVSVQDIGGYTVAPPPPPQPYTYTVQPGVISGIDTATTFTGKEAQRIEAYVTGVGREQAVYEANQPTISERIEYANRETMGAITGTTQTAVEAVSDFGNVALPLAVAVGAILLLRN
jgi:hypothetical protein